MELINESPFAADRVVLQDARGRDRLVVICKATYRVRGSEVAIADEQVPVQMGDVHWGEPDASSVRYESDLVPGKVGTDVVLVGHAYARSRASQVDVSLRAGPLRRVCRVFGERRWRRILTRVRLSKPKPFERIPLVYERAFGGADRSHPDPRRHEWEPRNTVGCGLLARRSTQDPGELPVPNVEDPRDPLRTPWDRPQPAGFGFLCRHWQPRLRYAGTYDEAWNRNRSPLLPLDFDPRYHNGASPGLTAGAPLAGGEPVEVLNASRDGVMRFSVPAHKPEIRWVTNGEALTELSPVLDTLVIEPDESRFTAVWRASDDVHGRIFDVGLVRVRARV